MTLHFIGDPAPTTGEDQVFHTLHITLGDGQVILLTRGDLFALKAQPAVHRVVVGFVWMAYPTSVSGRALLVSALFVDDPSAIGASSTRSIAKKDATGLSQTVGCPISVSNVSSFLLIIFLLPFIVDPGAHGTVGK